MTTAELRGLLAEVEKHGGPLRYIAEERADYVGIDFGAEGKSGSSIEDAMRPSVQYQLVGVLKRDLTQKSVGWNVDCLPGPASYTVSVWFDGNQYVVSGDSELEALLRAWLAAAEVEGWGS